MLAHIERKRAATGIDRGRLETVAEGEADGMMRRLLSGSGIEPDAVFELLVGTRNAIHLAVRDGIDLDKATTGMLLEMFILGSRTHEALTARQPDSERRDASSVVSGGLARARERRVVPLKVWFSQERDVHHDGPRTVCGEWRGRVSIRAVVDDAIVDFEAGPDGCESVPGPLRLSAEDRDHLRRLRADADELLGGA